MGYHEEINIQNKKTIGCTQAIMDFPIVFYFYATLFTNKPYFLHNVFFDINKYWGIGNLFFFEVRLVRERK